MPPFKSFYDGARAYHHISEQAYINARDVVLDSELEDTLAVDGAGASVAVYSDKNEFALGNLQWLTVMGELIHTSTTIRTELRPTSRTSQ